MEDAKCFPFAPLLLDLFVLKNSTVDKSGDGSICHDGRCKDFQVGVVYVVV